MFTGPEITSVSPAELRAFPWQGAITDSLPPDVRATIDPDIQRIQDEARVLVRARALERLQPIRLSARRASDFVRVNRVEGLSVGGGLTVRVAPRIFVSGRARVGSDDHRQGKGMANVRWEQPSGTRFEVFGGRDLSDIGDQVERSSVFNSIGAQEFASDATDPFSLATRGARLFRRIRGMDVSLTATQEQHKQLEVHSSPSSGTYLPTPEIDPLRGARLSIGIDRPLTAWRGPGLLRVEARGNVLRTTDPGLFEDMLGPGLTSYRASAGVEHRTSVGSTNVILRENAAALFGGTRPLQELVYFGGPLSLPGYALHEVAGTYGSATRLELQVPVPFIPIPLGRFGRIPGQARLAPYVSGAVVGGSVACTAVYGRCPALTEGFYPSAGVALLTIFDLLRVDVARGLKNGRWTFNVDVSRDFWSIL
ncbi:MAG: hypothetical protein ABIR92_01655 [Gemmatimonadaceae bacterium]